MEPNDQEVNWKEVASLLNEANEVLVEKIHTLHRKSARLQAQHQRIQNLTSFVKKGLNQNN